MSARLSRPLISSSVFKVNFTRKLFSNVRKMLRTKSEVLAVKQTRG